MRKKTFLLTAALLGVVTLPVASLVNCIGNTGQEQREKDDDQINPKGSYRTTLNQTETLEFELATRYSANEIGLEKIFSDQHEFEVQQYDDLAGEIVVDIHRISVDGSSSIIKRGVKIIGFKKINAVNFINQIRTQITKQGMFETALISDQKPSELDTKTIYKAADLGIDHHFNFRQAEHQIQIKKSDDKLGRLNVLITIALSNKKVATTFVIEGFLADDPELSQRVKFMQQVLKKISDSYQTEHSGKFPSEIVQRKADADFWDQLGIGEFPEYNDLAKHEVKLSFKNVRHNDIAVQFDLILLLIYYQKKSTKVTPTLNSFSLPVF
ncbi:lipoprotein 17-related variable surface protein [Mycoplasma sp. ATU-Cv-508]|uniref:lipoprotein 17-related variable surface protein n=1 Tax=Mycoplasma sp. ATU-Cv-508 TaxID=2048001 RepID=UPI000FDE2B77